MARAVAAQLSAFFSWAIPRLSFLADNPCRLAARPPKPRPRSRILSEQELSDLWCVLGQEAPLWNNAIKLILLTGQRRGEVFDADWNEFDLNRHLWTIPASRSKNGREHRVPLSAPAIEIIQGIPKGASAKLFPARGHPNRGASGFSKAMKRINKSVHAITNREANFTLHDLRRTVATGLQRLGVKLEVTEAVLNHVSGSRDGIVGIYQRYQFEDEKRIALDRWAIELAAIVDSRSGDGRRQVGDDRSP
jgi:integrase